MRQNSAPRPILIFDGDCAFCSTCVRFIQRRMHTSAEILPWQETDLVHYGLTEKQAQDALQWIAVSGRTSSGAAAVARLLIDAGGLWRPLGWITLCPPFSWLAAGVYRLIANNRHRLPGGTPACAIPPDKRPRPPSS